MSSLPRIAIMVGSQGRGSNMAALITACKSQQIPAEVALVISPKSDTKAIHRAQALGVETLVLPYAKLDYAEVLLEALRDRQIAWICLAGYMRLLPAGVVSAYERRILNIHPALLPKFGGKGMYGHHVHEAVLAAKETESGCTVHFVNERYDEGDIVLQKRCQVLPDDTVDTLSERVLDLEHLAYAEAMRMLLTQAD